MNFRNDYDWSKVEEPATDEEVTALVAALRSGDYTQGRGCLKDEDGNHCCLGVANEVFNLGLDPYNALMVRFETASYKATPLKLPKELQQHLYGLNDGGDSFAEIADHIEKGFGLTVKE